MSIPDLKAGGSAGKLDNKFLNYKHANNTLIISVRKHTHRRARKRERVCWGECCQCASANPLAAFFCSCILRLRAAHVQYVKPPFIVELEARNKAEIKKMGNGSTSASGAPQQGAANANAKAPSTAQKLLADAQASGSASSNQGGPAGGPGEFSGLNGLKGLAGKDGDCKQQ